MSTKTTNKKSKPNNKKKKLLRDYYLSRGYFHRTATPYDKEVDCFYNCMKDTPMPECRQKHKK